MALTAADLDDVRRYTGYPVAAALPYATLDVQGNEASLTAVLAALTDNQVTLVQSMLAQLRQLEADIPAVRQTIVVAKAGVFERNPGEVAEREGLFLSMRRRLCVFLGIPAGPGVYEEAGSAAVAPAVLVV